VGRPCTGDRDGGSVTSTLQRVSVDGINFKFAAAAHVATRRTTFHLPGRWRGESELVRGVWPR
jgi:hypothetical protein